MMLRFLPAILLALSATIAHAQDASIGGYSAFIGPEDLRNSSGARLDSAPAIIAQDRANYHRFGVRHTGDQSDPWFEGRGHRMAIPNLVQMSRQTADIITRQGAYVYVTVYADATGQMTRMVVEIPG